MSFAIALFPVGSHLEMCVNHDGHCHSTLNFCGIRMSHINNSSNYTSRKHTSCHSSGVFHNTEILATIFVTVRNNNLLSSAITSNNIFDSLSFSERILRSYTNKQSNGYTAQKKTIVLRV